MDEEELRELGIGVNSSNERSAWINRKTDHIAVGLKTNPFFNIFFKKRPDHAYDEETKDDQLQLFVPPPRKSADGVVPSYQKMQLVSPSIDGFFVNHELDHQPSFMDGAYTLGGLLEGCWEHVRNNYDDFGEYLKDTGHFMEGLQVVTGFDKCEECGKRVDCMC
jgi:hypothetical protein